MATHTTLSVQQRPASTYNRPCEDLFDGGTRREYLDIIVPLYRASIRGDQKAAQLILKGCEHLARYSITERNETPLHVATAGHNTEFVRYLVNMMKEVDLELRDKDGNTPFCVAAISGNVQMVKIMVEKNRALPMICGRENMTPLCLAAFHGNRDMVSFLYDQYGRMRGDGCWTNDVMDTIMMKCIQADIFDVALRILKDNEELPQDKQLCHVLLALARKPRVFHEIRGRTIINKIKSFLAFTGLMSRPPLNDSNATPLLRFLWKRIMKKPKDVIDEILRGPKAAEEDKPETYPFQILFIAAKMNNRNFLIELIREYPDLIWKRNDFGQTIFHISVLHRHHNIYSLLYEIGSMKDQITPIIDNQGNNILHLAGKNAEKNAYDQGWEAAPFYIYNEFLWYKEVEDMLPPPCREVKNMAGQTPQELFIENHKDLVFKGIKSINETINISMVVAALVCTIGFSVVYSIPGGFDGKNGFPMFLHNRHFILFIILDSMSFIFATSSIFSFLSVILSRQQGNTEFLLKRWVAGQLLLLESVMFVVCSFFISFFIMYCKSACTYIIHGVAYPTIIIYAAVCIYIISDVVKATYGTKHLFRPKKYTLYLRN